jgi:hypothetical protein
MRPEANILHGHLVLGSEQAPQNHGGPSACILEIEQVNNYSNHIQKLIS